jgi:predicted amidohydrolase
MMASQRKDQLKVAWVQSCAQGTVEDNLHELDRQLAQFAGQSIDLVVLPEAFAWLKASARDQLAWAETLGDGVIQSWVAEWAKRLSTYVIAGSIPMRSVETSTDASAMYSTLVVMNPQGEIETAYRKIHLFSVRTPNGQVFKESTVFSAGQSPVVWDSPWGKIGLAICFDVRFSELFLAYRQQGVRMVILPSAFTRETGQAHWHVLVRSRAIEQQMFVLAVNQTGWHDTSLHSYGHSLLVNPWGEVLLDAGIDVSQGVISLSLDQSDHLRDQFPLQHQLRCLGLVAGE